MAHRNRRQNAPETRFDVRGVGRKGVKSTVRTQASRRWLSAVDHRAASRVIENAWVPVMSKRPACMWGDGEQERWPSPATRSVSSRLDSRREVRGTTPSTVDDQLIGAAAGSGCLRQDTKIDFGITPESSGWDVDQCACPYWPQ